MIIRIRMLMETRFILLSTAQIIQSQLAQQHGAEMGAIVLVSTEAVHAHIMAE